MTLQDACAELARWLPFAQLLITEPDTDGTRTHTAPTSRPPWNGAVAVAVLDAHEGVRRLEPALRADVTGHPGPRRGGSNGNTHAAIAAIGQLGYAVPAGIQREATILLTRWITTIQQLPAIDEAERWQRVASPCPYCQFEMLRVAPRSGRVACLRGGTTCFDAEGNAPTGVTEMGRLGPVIRWRDGLVT